VQTAHVDIPFGNPALVGHSFAIVDLIFNELKNYPGRWFFRFRSHGCNFGGLHD
jgi:hypothetical protein